MPPDVRKDCDLPTRPSFSLRGYAPEIGAQPQGLNIVATVGHSRPPHIRRHSPKTIPVGLPIIVSLPMVIKESSDEFNPPVLKADPALVTSRPPRSTKDYLALAIATCGVGYLPLAPGTWGSLVGVALFVLVRGALMKLFFGMSGQHKLSLLNVYYAVVAFELVVVFAIALIGTWAASRTERLSARKDPGKVVVDEVVGQFIALIPVPFLLQTAWWT